MKFLVAKNLTEMNLSEGEPWEFGVDDKDNVLKKMPKDKRRQALLKPTTTWQVYTAVRGCARNLRISKTNPPGALLGLVADFDMVSNIDTVLGYINQLEAHLRPTFIERSLSNKIRLVWLFEREILTPSVAFCTELIQKFFDIIGVPTLLPGYDAASTKPTEMWTNGATWYDVPDAKPLSWDFCFGVVCDVSKKTSLFEKGEIPLETIAEEVQKRFPNRWQGEFKLDVTGVRFWDEAADNATGAQVKPDGMLCFTGNEPFMKWESIFGRQWCEEQRILNLGQSAEDIYFDGKNYWEQQAGRWETTVRTDIILRLKGRGLSDKAAKGQTQSDVERVLDHIQQVNRVNGAAPLINYPTGLVDLDGRRVLNIADLNPVLPVAPTDGPCIPDKHFPFIWGFLNGFFPRPELNPLDHFLAWLQRGHYSILNHKRYMGQAVFICGPRNNGKTLLCLRIVAPLLGRRIGNPIDFMTGETSFNSELFSAALLAVNDEDSPNGENARKRMMAKLKGLVVNPVHKYHAKFEKPVTMDWIGRILITLNDDPGSVGMLMEVEKNTHDKQSYYASQPYKGKFPPQEQLEADLAKELPYFSWWLLNVYKPLESTLSDDRMGVKSYFDPRILELANQQTFSSNLAELIQVWVKVDAYWGDDKTHTWEGTPTELLSHLQTCEHTQAIAREWTQHKIAKSLTALAKQDGSGVEFIGENGRHFKLSRNIST